jgi:hypothetical protein
MTRPGFLRWRTVSRALIGLVSLSVPVLAVVLFVGQTAAVPAPNAADELRVLDPAAFSNINKAKTTARPPAPADDATEVEVTNWENTGTIGTSGHHF